MTDLKKIIENENLEDVLTVFALTFDYRKLDFLYTHSKFDVISKGQLLVKYNELFSKGILADNNGDVVKGPYWKAPKFVTDSNYGF